MKRCGFLLLAASFCPVAFSQAPSPAQNGIHLDGRCREVHPGDTVHYDLTIEGLEAARMVYADLRLRPSREAAMFRPVGLPAPDFRNLGGGGSTRPEQAEPKLFHFSFVVPQEIYSGTYRGVEVMIHAAGAATVSEPAEYVEVSRHTRKQVRGFCLNVVSPFGGGIPTRPVVVDFQPGLIVPRQ